MPDIAISFEEARGCGFRKASKDGVGIYLIGTGEGEPCERLPFPLEVCPACGGGIKPSRGFTWINPTLLFAPEAEPCCDVTVLLGDHSHSTCFMCTPEHVGAQAGLLWVGEEHYPSPAHFMSEARRMGISRKIGALPRGFVAGETVIYLAHRKVKVRFEDGKPVGVPGVFYAFRPIRVDLVIDDDPDDLPDRALNLYEQVGADHARIVKVIPTGPVTENMFDE
jgi:hypothetical protein